MYNYGKTNKFFIENINFKNKNVVLRLDLNVPLKKGLITDETRINKIIPDGKKITVESKAKGIKVDQLLPLAKELNKMFV